MGVAEALVLRATRWTPGCFSRRLAGWELRESFGMESVRRWSRDGSPLFGLDLRSLAVCRILSGLVIVVDLATRASELRLHYTDDGILPLANALSTSSYFPSIYFAVGSVSGVAALMCVHACFGLALTLGYRTTLITVICWYLTRSLQLRNHMVLNGGDIVFGAVLFWAMFLPWGARWSLDALCRGPQPEPQNGLHHSVASVLFALQLPFIYWLSVVHKLEPTWLRGDSVYYALNSHLYARHWGQLLLAYPALLAPLAYATFVWEALGPFLLLCPWPRVRAASCAGFALMHLGFGAFLKIGIFAVTPLLFLIALTPGEIWERVFRKPLTAAVRPLGRLARRLPVPPDFRVRPEFRPVLIFLGIFSLFQGVGQDGRLRPLVPPSLGWVERWTGLQQRWTVFVNLPALDDGWVVVEGQAADGQSVDIFQGNQPVEWGPPRDLSRLHGLYRWPTPLVVILSNPSLQKVFLNALVQDWNRRYPQQALREARFYFVHCPMRPDHEDRVPNRQLLTEWKAES